MGWFRVQGFGFIGSIQEVSSALSASPTKCPDGVLGCFVEADMRAQQVQWRESLHPDSPIPPNLGIWALWELLIHVSDCICGVSLWGS